MDGEINKSCGLDIHKHFIIATILSRSGEKQLYRFARDEEGILNLKDWAISEKCDVVVCESASDFWVPIYESLIDHLPVIVGNASVASIVKYRIKPITNIQNHSILEG